MLSVRLVRVEPRLVQVLQERQVLLQVLQVQLVAVLQ
jgi:hypothetical protein